MAKKLIVAEKPFVARDIARVLGVKGRGEGCLVGEDYVVTWAVGHLVSLCEPGETDARWVKWSMAQLPMLPEDIPLKVLPKTKSQFAVIKKLMKDHNITSACYVGDTQGDLDAAELAGMPFIYCAFGFGAVDHYWKKIDTFADLLEL